MAGYHTKFAVLPVDFKYVPDLRIFFLKADLKSGSQDGAFGTKRNFLAQKLSELTFLFEIFLFLNKYGSRRRRRRTHLTQWNLNMFPRSKNLSEDIFGLSMMGPSFYVLVSSLSDLN
jgi:hypothetical protein